MEVRGSPTSSHEAGHVGTSGVQRLARRLLGLVLISAGVAHLTWWREEFQAQVPSWFPVDADLVVVVSGLAEIALGVALLLAVDQRPVGWITAGFFVVIFPGNVAQFVEGTDAFGLSTDQARAMRLAFQPLLVAWALWSTGAWDAWCRRGGSPGPTQPGRRHDAPA